MRELPAGCVIWVMGTFRLFLIRATCTPDGVADAPVGLFGGGCSAASSSLPVLSAGRFRVLPVADAHTVGAW